MEKASFHVAFIFLVRPTGQFCQKFLSILVLVGPYFFLALTVTKSFFSFIFPFSSLWVI